jgi:anti-sigma regulatory factor (Ser/Thr protein kinase)
MCPAATPAPHPGGADRRDSFRHEAFVYRGEREFVDGASAFIREGVGAGEPTLVVVSPAKIALLRSELNGESGDVLFADMDVVGSNPARIIPAWRDFVDEHSGGGRRLRGIGEPVRAGRGPAELVECHRHESLLNLAFHDSHGFWLLCPYDAAELDPEVIDEVFRTHPMVTSAGAREQSAEYGGLEAAAAPFAAPLPEPRAVAHELDFEAGSLAALRAAVSEHAQRAGIPDARTDDFVLAVNEVATNSVRHAAGGGRLRLWSESDALVCEIRDEGVLEEPLAGRVRPTPGQAGGYGLWLANQFCELVQVRSFASGTVVRLHMQTA